jgi:hypothetical protein
MSSDAEQKGEFVRQRKRMAMGVKLDGTNLKGKGEEKTQEKKQGGLAQAKKNK